MSLPFIERDILMVITAHLNNSPYLPSKLLVGISTVSSDLLLRYQRASPSISLDKKLVFDWIHSICKYLVCQYDLMKIN
jgi:hypothetical protein